jgi:hypothetical protein
VSILGKILKTGLDVVTTPIDVVKDVATMGGALTGEQETYTGKKIRRLGEDLEEIRDEVDKL